MSAIPLILWPSKLGEKPVTADSASWISIRMSCISACRFSAAIPKWSKKQKALWKETASRAVLLPIIKQIDAKPAGWNIDFSYPWSQKSAAFFPREWENKKCTQEQRYIHRR